MLFILACMPLHHHHHQQHYDSLCMCVYECEHAIVRPEPDICMHCIHYITCCMHSRFVGILFALLASFQRSFHSLVCSFVFLFFPCYLLLLLCFAFCCEVAFLFRSPVLLIIVPLLLLLLASVVWLKIAFRLK